MDPSPPPPSTPPEAFLCPICGRLMEDPVVLPPSGRSFDRHCITISLLLDLYPSSSPVHLTPNVNLRSAILTYTRNLPHTPNARVTAASTRERNPQSFPSAQDENARKPRPSDVSDKEETRSLTHQHPNLTPSSFPLSSPFQDSNPLPHPPNSPITSTSTREQNPQNFPPIHDEIVRKLRSLDASEQEEALLRLRRETRERKEQRALLCTPTLLSSLLPHLESTVPPLQSDAAASLVNLSLHPINRTAVARSGAVPALVAALRSPLADVRSHAAAALFVLSTEPANVSNIGALGAIPSLVEVLRVADEPAETRVDAARAIYYLSSSCKGNATELARSGVVGTLLEVAVEEEELGGGALGKAALMVAMVLAGCNEGTEALAEGGAVEAMVGMVRRGRSVGLCMSVLYGLRKLGWRFWVLGRGVGMEEVLGEVWGREGEEGMEKAAEMAKRILLAMSVEGEGGGGNGGGDERGCVTGIVAREGGEGRRERGRRLRMSNRF